MRACSWLVQVRFCASTSFEYLQLENGEVGKEVVRSIVELLGEVVVQDIEILRVVSVDARDQLFDVLRSRGWRYPVGRTCGFGSHVRV